MSERFLRLGGKITAFLLAIPLAPIFVSVVIGISLGVVGQFNELYLAYVEALAGGGVQPAVSAGPGAAKAMAKAAADTSSPWFPIVLALVMLALLSFSIYIATRELGRYTFKGPQGQDLVDDSLQRKILILGFVAALVPLCGLIYGVHQTIEQARSHIEQLKLASEYFSGGLPTASIEGLSSVLPVLKLPFGISPVFGLIMGIGAVVGLYLLSQSLWHRTCFHLYRTCACTAESVFRQYINKAAGMLHDSGRRFETETLPEFGRKVRGLAVALILALAIGNLLLPIFLDRISDAQTASLRAALKPFWHMVQPVFQSKSPMALWIDLFMLLTIPLLAAWLTPARWKHYLARKLSLRPGIAHTTTALRLVYWAVLLCAGVGGLVAFSWVDVARLIGPLATALAVILVIFALVVAICIACREIGLPSLAGILVVGLLVIAAKLHWPWFFLLSFAVVLATTALAFERRKRKASALAFGLAVYMGVAFFFPPASPMQKAIGQLQTAKEKETAKKNDTVPAIHDIQVSVLDRFATWYDARRPLWDKAAGEGKPLPVLLVAAEGGGIYAAAAASTFLARMQERCGNFSQHVFAISAVSGGSVGATVFERLARERNTRLTMPDCNGPNAGGMLEAETRSIMTQDHLSPIVGLLVPDFLGLHSDRAEGLVKSIRTDLRRTASDRRQAVASTEDALFATYWDPTRAAPALVLNTTSVLTGDRVAFAPFDLKPAASITLTTFAERWMTGTLDVTLIEAAVVSARFPGVVPAFQRPRESDAAVWSFVDGGYVDASGALTTYDIYKLLQDNVRPRKWNIDLRVVLVTSTQSSDGKAGSSWAGLRDLSAPIETVLNVRSLLSRNAVRDTIAKIDDKAFECLDRLDHASQHRPLASASDPAAPGCARGENWKVTLVEHDLEYFKLPLGWKLSNHSFDVVAMQLGRADLCDKARDEARTKRRIRTSGANEEVAAKALEAAITIRANSCVMASLESLISAKPDARAQK